MSDKSSRPSQKSIAMVADRSKTQNVLVIAGLLLLAAPFILRIGGWRKTVMVLLGAVLIGLFVYNMCSVMKAFTKLNAETMKEGKVHQYSALGTVALQGTVCIAGALVASYAIYRLFD